MDRYEEKELQQEMEQVEKYLSDCLRDPGYGGAVGNILRDMQMSKGKRLRPRLLLMASRYGDGQEPGRREKLCRLGALVELVHMASLIHDDIVDDAPLRRGLPTTQSKYGKDMAVYAGDLILSRIVQSLFRDGFYRVGALFGQAVESMCLGELGQMECRGREDITVEQYMHNIYGKTAALCRLACLAGAVESGCSEDVQAQLEQLGINLGRNPDAPCTLCHAGSAGKGSDHRSSAGGKGRNFYRRACQNSQDNRHSFRRSCPCSSGYGNVCGACSAGS